MLNQMMLESGSPDLQGSVNILSELGRLEGKNKPTSGKKQGIADGQADEHFMGLLKEGLAALSISKDKAKTSTEGGSINTHHMKNVVEDKKKNNTQREPEMEIPDPYHVFESTASTKRTDLSPLDSDSPLPMDENTLDESGEVTSPEVMKGVEMPLEYSELTATIQDLLLLHSPKNENTVVSPPDIQPSGSVEDMMGNVAADLLTGSTELQINMPKSVSNPADLSIGSAKRHIDVPKSVSNTADLSMDSAKRHIDVLKSVSSSADLSTGNVDQHVNMLNSDSIFTAKDNVVDYTISRETLGRKEIPVVPQEQNSKGILVDGQGKDVHASKDLNGKTSEAIPAVTSVENRNDRGVLSSFSNQTDTFTKDPLISLLREKGIEEGTINKIITTLEGQKDAVAMGRKTDRFSPNELNSRINIKKYGSESEAIHEPGVHVVPADEQVGDAVVSHSREALIFKTMTPVSNPVQGNDGGTLRAEDSKPLVRNSSIPTIREKGIEEGTIHEKITTITDQKVGIEKATDDLLVHNRDRIMDPLKYGHGTAKEHTVTDPGMTRSRESFSAKGFTPSVQGGGANFVQMEGQDGDVSVNHALKEGILRPLASVSNAAKGNDGGTIAFSQGKTDTPSVVHSMISKPMDFNAYVMVPATHKELETASIDGSSLVSQIASQLPSDMEKGSRRIKITLYPEHLGSLDMDILLRENKVQVVLMVDNKDVRQELQSNGDQLKNALREQGVQVDGIDFLLRQSPQEMNSGSGGSHLWWRGDDGTGRGTARVADVPAASAIPALVSTKKSGALDGGRISLFV